MSLRPLTADEYRRALGIMPDGEGAPDATGLAELCRSAIWRWGLCRRATLTRFLKGRFEAAALDADRCAERQAEVLERLLAVGDIAEVSSGGSAHLARVAPRWIRLSETAGTVVGSIPSRLLGDPWRHGGLVRRFDPRDGDAVAALRARGVDELALQDWLGPPGFVACVRRAGGDAGGPLSGLWPLLMERLLSEGLPVGDPSSISVLGGRGDFFGQPASDGKERGRWTAPDRDGVWLGKRRGQAEKHFHPVIVDVSGGVPTRARDLHDEDEFRWALIARGLVSDREEVVRAVPEAADGLTELAFTFPLPRDILRVLSLVGEPAGAWRWRVPNALVDRWRIW